MDSQQIFDLLGICVIGSPALLLAVLGLTALAARPLSERKINAWTYATTVLGLLAFASLTQVGIIVAEIGLGLRYIALVHIIGHACMRTLQLLRAPTLLHDYHTLQNAIGGHLHQRAGFWERVLPAGSRPWFYRAALERGYLDSFINEWIVYPFQRVFQWCDAAERLWTDLLSGGGSRESDKVEPHGEIVEELRL